MITRITDSLYESTDILSAFQFIKKHTSEIKIVMDLIHCNDTYFIQQHSEPLPSIQYLIATYEAGKQTRINFTEILKGLNECILQMDSSLRNCVVQVIERIDDKQNVASENQLNLLDEIQ